MLHFIIDFTHIALKEHDDLILSVLLRCQNLRVEAIDALGNMALHCAALCIGMEPAIVQEVIARTPADKINAQNEKGDTALSIAIRARNESFALALLARPEIDLSLYDTEGNSPLHVAAAIANPLLSKGLIDALVTRADEGTLNMRQVFVPNNTALIIAIRARNESFTLALLARPEIDLSLCDTECNSPLHIAAAIANPILSQGLIDALVTRADGGALNMRQVLEPNNTALIIAIRARNESFALALLARPEIDLSLYDTEGNSPLHVAAAIANPPLSQGLIDALVARADERALNEQQALEPHNTALIIAIRHNNIGFVQRLLAHRYIDLNFYDATRQTPLHIAIEMGRLECIRALIAHRDIELNAPDHTGNTPAHYAIVAGLPLILRNALLTAPSVIYSIQDADRVGNTSRSPSLQLDIQLAIARRADLRLPNISGNNPIHIVAQIGGIDHRLVQRLAKNTTYREAIHTFNFCSQLPSDLSRNATSVVKKLITPYLPTRCLLKSKNYFSVHADSQNPSIVEFPAEAAPQHAEQPVQAGAAAAAQGTVQQDEARVVARVAGKIARVATERMVSKGLSKL